MNSKVSVDFSSFGKVEEEPQLAAAAEGPAVPPMVKTPQLPSEPGAESAVMTEPAEPSRSALSGTAGGAGDGEPASGQSGRADGDGGKPVTAPAPVHVAVTAAGDELSQIPAEVVRSPSGAVKTAAEPVPRVTIEPVQRVVVDRIPVNIITIELVTDVPESAANAPPSAPAAADPSPSLPAATVNAAANVAAVPPSAGTKVTDTTTGTSTSTSSGSSAPATKQEQTEPELIVPDIETPPPPLPPPPLSAELEPQQQPELTVPDIETSPLPMTAEPKQRQGPEPEPEPKPEPKPTSQQTETGKNPGSKEREPKRPEPEPDPKLPEPGPGPKRAELESEPKRPELESEPKRPELEPKQSESESKQPEPDSKQPESGSAAAVGRRQGRQERGQQEAAERPPPPAPELAADDVHCLVCNDSVEPGTGGGIQLADYLENAPVRVEDKLGSVINNDYRLYLHSEVVCGRCHTTLCQIHDLEMQTKHLKDQVVGFFWDTVEVRRVRPQRKGRRKSRPSKLLLESQETALFMPEVEIQEDPTDVIYKAPPKKIGRYSKPKVYERLSHNEYQCIRCHKVLPRMRAVVKHFDLVHGPKEEQCDICDKYFRDRTHLNRHKHKMHPVVQIVDIALPAAAQATSSSPADIPTTATTITTAAAAIAASAVTSTSPASSQTPSTEPPTLGCQTPVQTATEPAVKQEAVSPDLALPLDDDTLPGDEDDDAEDDDVNDEDCVAERAPVIDGDEEDGEMGEVDMDVVMNVEVERPRRGRKRSLPSQSSGAMANEVGIMYTVNGADGSSPRFQCTLCPNTYSRASKARDHFIAKHAQIKRFQCNICAESFFTYKQKRHHELSHTAEVCTRCGKKYPGNKRGMLERHMVQCGELKKCRVCGAEFENVADFIKHRRDAHEKSATCDVCGKIVSARNLASHRAIHSDERNYTCHLCGSSFKAKGSLDTHLRTHSEDRPFSCATCGRSFKHRNNWKDHERGHLNIRDFVCHFCSKSFKQAKNLKQHLRQHDANPEIFNCPHCPSTFRYKYNMLAHIKTLHTGETSRRVRRRIRAPSELSGAGSSVPGGSHEVLVGLDPLQLSPGSVTSDSNSGVHTITGPPGAVAVQGQHTAGARSLPQLNPLNPSVVFMQTLQQHHSIFSS